MKKNVIACFIVAIICSFSYIRIRHVAPVRTIKNESFTKGEKLSYKIHVGPINAATGEMIIDENIHTEQERPCYKVDVYGRTNGFFDWIVKVRDHWGSYIDTASILPLKSYRYIEEAKYRKNEIVFFDHNKNTVAVHKLDKQTKKLKEIKPYSVSQFSQGLISGYYFLRATDFSSISIGDTLNIAGFFDGDTYDFNLIYRRIENVKTKIGRFDAHVLSPIMPESSIFDGENSVQIWLSADKRKIPLKAKAKLFIGALEVDVTDVEGLVEY